MCGAAQLALPGTPPGPGSPPPLGVVQVVGYAPLPSGDPAAYLSPRAQLAGGGSAPASPMRQEWLGVRVCHSPKCLLIPCSPPNSAENQYAYMACISFSGNQEGSSVPGPLLHLLDACANGRVQSRLLDVIDMLTTWCAGNDVLEFCCAVWVCAWHKARCCVHGVTCSCACRARALATHTWHRTTEFQARPLHTTTPIPLASLLCGEAPAWQGEGTANRVARHVILVGSNCPYCSWHVMVV